METGIIKNFKRFLGVASCGQGVSVWMFMELLNPLMVRQYCSNIMQAYYIHATKPSVSVKNKIPKLIFAFAVPQMGWRVFSGLPISAILCKQINGLLRAVLLLACVVISLQLPV